MSALLCAISVALAATVPVPVFRWSSASRVQSVERVPLRIDANV